MTNTTGFLNLTIVGRREYAISDPYFNGLMDEVGNYRRALSEDEITANYEAAGLDRGNLNQA